MTQTAAIKTQTHQEQAAKKVALVVRVSTDIQAMKNEGSLVNQLQRLRKHIDYKREAYGEAWVEAGVYELRAVSGKDSVRSPEFQRLFADIQSGRVNIVAATALDRMTRSVKDFLTLFEFLQEHHVEFVSLKEQCDTSTPVGRLFATMVMALAQFEREQTSERTKDANTARAERGLWNGGRILGYDPDPANRSSLTVNPDEASVVASAFDIYLDTGSLKETSDRLNSLGFRTKVYESRRGRQHSGKAFRIATVQQILKNRAYAGQKEVNKRNRGNAGGYQVVPASWPAIVSLEKFEEVQKLMAVNGQSRHNNAEAIHHVHVLSGLLNCAHCGTPMQGRSGTGRLGVRYYYYVCSNRECGVRVAAGEVEAAILERIGEMAQTEGMLERLVAETNTRLQSQKPALVRRQRTLQRNLEEVNSQAGNLLTQLSGVKGDKAQVFVSEKLNSLALRREELEQGLMEVEQELMQLQDHAVTADVVRQALANVHQVYEHLKPFEQRELMRLVVHRAEIGEEEIVLEIYGNLCTVEETQGKVLDGSLRFGRQIWLPDEDSNLEPSG